MAIKRTEYHRNVVMSDGADMHIVGIFDNDDDPERSEAARFLPAVRFAPSRGLPVAHSGDVRRADPEAVSTRLRVPMRDQDS